MQFLAERSFIYNAYTKEMQKIKGGPFLKKMFAEMLEKRNGKLSPSNRKLFIYSAHDWTVGNIMASLNLWKGQMLRFAVTLIFELHQNQQTGEYYIEVRRYLHIQAYLIELIVMVFYSCFADLFTK